MNADEFHEQIAAMRRKIGDLEQRLPSFRNATVTAVNAATSTFTANVDGMGKVAGIESDADKLPGIGDVIQLSLSGSTPIYQAGRPSATVGSTTGRQTSNVSPDGVASFQRVESAEDPVFQGLSLNARLSKLPRGLVGFGQIALAQTAGIGTGEFGVVEVAFTPEAGRSYELVFQNLNMSGTVASDDVWMWVRYSTDGTKPNGGYPALIGPVRQFIGAANRFQNTEFSSFLLGLPANAGAQPMYRLLVTVARGAGGSGTLTAVACNPVVRVLDTGQNVVNTGVINTGGAGSSTAVQNYDIYVDCLWSQTYDLNGNPYTEYGSELGQGQDSTAGNMRSMAGWPSTLASSTLSGATIDLIELQMTTNYTAASTATASIGQHAVSAGAAPATFSGTPNLITVSGWAANQTKTIDITSWASGIQSGAIRGITTGPVGTPTTGNYMWWNGAAMVNPPKLHIKYKK